MQAELRKMQIGDFVDVVEPVRPRLVSQVERVAWYIVLIEPQQEVTVGWRMHELGAELYSPIVRRQVKTGRLSKDGRKDLRIAPRPMFPGYGFIATNCGLDLPTICKVKGVRDVLRGIVEAERERQPVTLPNEAVMAIRTKERDEHAAWLATLSPKSRAPRFKAGDTVRVESGPFADIIGKVERVDRRGRIEMLFKMLKLSLHSDEVVIAR